MIIEVFQEVAVFVIVIARSRVQCATYLVRLSASEIIVKYKKREKCLQYY